MGPKVIIILAVLCFASLNEGKPTFGLLNKLKNSVSDSRCKLHKIGAKVLEHEHAHDPCEEKEISSTTTYIVVSSTPTTTEIFLEHLDIDVRSSPPGNTIQKSYGYASVPDDGGRNIGRVKCNQGQVQTADGCMDEA